MGKDKYFEDEKEAVNGQDITDGTWFIPNNLWINKVEGGLSVVYDNAGINQFNDGLITNCNGIIVEMNGGTIEWLFADGVVRRMNGGIINRVSGKALVKMYDGHIDSVESGTILIMAGVNRKPVNELIGEITSFGIVFDLRDYTLWHSGIWTARSFEQHLK